MSNMNAVEHVFSIMAATYGSAWDRSLGQAPIADVKTVWANALDGFMHSDAAKKAVVWGLKNLPARVPNSIEFRDLCRQAPAAKVPELPSPIVNPEIAAKVLGGLKASAITPVDNRAWAKAILRDVENGVRRTPTVIQMAKNALAVA